MNEKILKYNNKSVDSIVKYAKSFVDKSLLEVLDNQSISTIKDEINYYQNKRKGHFGDLIEEYLFQIENNNDAQPDFKHVGIELKTTPLKQLKSKKYSPKERLVFSMINYMTVINETWETSSFLKKNRLLLLMFYLFEEDKNLLEYRFKIVELLDLLSEISIADIAQIKLDWETIVNKIKNGEAHLLSKGDTLYLGAAPKASNSSSRREQPNSDIEAKPRAFSLKTTYLKYLIDKLLHNKNNQYSTLNDKGLPLTIEENVQSRFSSYIGKSNVEIEKLLDISYLKRPKSHRRLLVNKILGSKSNKIEEFEKANITLRVIALEHTGKLKESISFPIFKYTEIVNESWEESDFYNQLTQRKFLFIIFRKTKDNNTILEKVKFWNFPMKDIKYVEWVWKETVRRIKNKQAHDLPKIRDNLVAHVRPHGRNKEDTIDTGYGIKEIKKCFWLNAKYIQKEIL
jgi:DNA mismatch repair protein MutH